MKGCAECGAGLPVDSQKVYCDPCLGMRRARQKGASSSRARLREEYLRVKEGGKPKYNLKMECKDCGAALPEGSKITRWYCDEHKKQRQYARVKRWKDRQRREKQKLEERRRRDHGHGVR